MNATDTFRLRGWLAQLCVITLICVSATVPAINLSESLPFVKAEQLLLPLVFLIYLWLLLAGLCRPIGWNIMFAVGFLYCVCNVISIWYGAEILGHSIILRDFYELPKVWLPVAFFTVAYEAELTESSLQHLIAFFSFAVLPVCMYAWAQSTSMGFTYKLNAYYSSGGHIDQALQYAGRVYSTMGNPNVLGQFMTWCVVLFMLAALYKVGSRWWNALVALACLTTLAMTGSRFGLLTLAVGVLLIFVVSSARRLSLLQVAFLVLLIPVCVWTYQTVASHNPRTLARYRTLNDPWRIDSFRQRLDEVWRDQWEDFTKSPLLGNGPAKALDRRGYSDSEYLSVLKEKGILGLIVFLGYYLYPLYLLRRGQRALASSRHSLLLRAPAAAVSIHFAFIAGILALMMDIPMSTFYSPFLQGFLWLWLGIGVRSANTVQETPQLII